MSLDGVRAWIGLIERKLTMRTRVFLVLVAIAVGGAATGIVLAIDAQNDAITKSDLESVRDEIEERTGSAESGTELATLEAELRELREEVAELRSGNRRQSSSGTNGGSSPATSVPPAVQELAEKAKEQSAK